MPLFSVVVPTYNRASFLDAMLGSVWAQQNIAPDEIEVIVIDDGSTDDTPAVLEQQRAKYPDHLKAVRVAHGGPGQARNRGIALARGTYVAFLDSDDLWFPWTAATYAEIIQTRAQPGLILGRAHEFFAPESDSLSLEATLQKARDETLDAASFADYLSASGEGVSFGASGIVVRRDELEKVGGFTPRWINAEDLDLMMKLGAAENFVLVRAPETYAYRKHPFSAVSDLARTLDGMKNLVAQERSGNYPGGESRRDERARILARHLRPVCLRCAHEGDLRAARALYRATFGWHLRQKNARFLLGALGHLLAARLNLKSRR